MRDRVFRVEVQKGCSRGKMIGTVVVSLDETAQKMANAADVDLAVAARAAASFMVGERSRVIGVQEVRPAPATARKPVWPPVLDLKKAAGEVPAGNNRIRVFNGGTDAVQSDAGRSGTGQGTGEAHQPVPGGGEGGGARTAGKEGEGVDQVPGPVPPARDV